LDGDANQLDENIDGIRQAIYLGSQVTRHRKLSKRSAASDKSEADIDRWWKQLPPSSWRKDTKSRRIG